LLINDQFVSIWKRIFFPHSLRRGCVFVFIQLRGALSEEAMADV
jgi:hypothetical protein